MHDLDLDFKNNKKYYLPSLLVDPPKPCPMGSVSAAAAAISLLHHTKQVYVNKIAHPSLFLSLSVSTSTLVVLAHMVNGK